MIFVEVYNFARGISKIVYLASYSLHVYHQLLVLNTLLFSSERRLGRARWSFCVQMLGGADGCNKYTLNLVVCKGQ